MLGTNEKQLRQKERKSLREFQRQLKALNTTREGHKKLKTNIKKLRKETRRLEKQNFYGDLK